jgi:hypothetical protein
MLFIVLKKKTIKKDISNINIMKKSIIVMALRSTMIIGGIIFATISNMSQVVTAQTNTTNMTSAANNKNVTIAKSGNLTAPIAPQGTSLNVSNAT